MVADAKKAEEEKRRIAELELRTAGDVVATTIDLLFQDEQARRKHHDLYMVLSSAKIIMDGVQEVAAIWKYAAENPLNGLTGGIAGSVIAGIQTALATARTMMALSQLGDVPGYAAGGATGPGLGASPMATMLEYSGLRVASNGKLTDSSGFAVAGIVHEDEYVIPKWLRQDPQVAAFEQWVEAKRVRGYYEGGATGGSSPAAPPLPALGTDGAGSTEVLFQMLGVLRSLDGRLAGVESWQREFQVVLDVQGHQRTVDEARQVQYESAIRPSRK